MNPVTSRRLDLPGIRHGFFTREGGVSTGIHAGLNCGPGSDDDPAAVAENRRRVAAHLGATALLSCWQVHGAEVVTVGKSPEFRVQSSGVSPGVEALNSGLWTRDSSTRPKADGMVTDRPGIALGILTADCGPVLLADAQTGVIGACHAGWKGAHCGVIEATVAAMETLGARRLGIVAALGPCIAQGSYEVSAEFRDALLRERADSDARFARGRPGHFQFDLKGFIGDRLAESGIARAEILPEDTYADETRFFSYRRTTHRGEPDYGRQVSAVMLAGE